MFHRFLILLIDDDPSLCDILTRASISSFPEATFIHAHNSHAAKLYINGLEGHGPTLILLDLDLGDNTTGIDFIAFLRAHPEARYLPVVMLTINDIPALIRLSYHKGVTAFTIKPFSFDEWKLYLENLRDYWFKTVTIPRISFRKQMS